MESKMLMGTSYFQVAIVCFGLAIILAVFIVYNVYKKPVQISSFVGYANVGSGGSPVTGPAPMVGATPINPNLPDQGVPYRTGTNGGSNATSNGPKLTPQTKASEGPTEGFSSSEDASLPRTHSDPNQAWALAHPPGTGDLAGKNFLNAGALISVNTVGQSLRNGSWDVRSEPANPQVALSPWFNSTIEPDVNRRTLDAK